MVLNISWKDEINNITLYKESPTIRERRLKLAGHLNRHNDIMAHKLVLVEPINGHARKYRKTITYVDNLKEDSGLLDNIIINFFINDMRIVMLNRDVWRDLTKKSRARVRHK